MRSPRMRQALAALAAAPLLFLAACGSPSDSDDASLTSGPDDAAVTSMAPNGDLADIAVEDGDDAPTLTWNGSPVADGDLPFVAAETTSRQLEAGDGDEVAEGDEVYVRYLMVSGTTGETVLSTFDEDDLVVTMDLNNTNLFQAFLDELPGRAAGESFLMAVTQEDAFGPEGNINLGVNPEDTLIFFVEVVSSHPPLTEAQGEPVEPEEGLPQVEADGASEAQITIPEDAEEPSELVSQVLIQGEGPQVRAGQTIRVHYTGVTFADGEQFDSSYSRNEPATFGIGVGQVISGWDQGLVGQNVGSRVLLVIPAADAYGEDPDAHELGDQTLVFVVDILGAY